MIKKGNVIATLDPQLIVSLSQTKVNVPNGLPHANELEVLLREFRYERDWKDYWKDDICCQNFVRRVLGKGTTAGYTVVTALAGTTSKQLRVNCNMPLQQPHLTDEEEEFVTEAYTYVQSVIDLNQWIALYHQIRQTVYLTECPHPLTLYASDILPKLTRGELRIVFEVLQPILLTMPKSVHEENLFLCLTQAIQDQCQHLPIAIIPSLHIKHSCLPNVAFDWNPKSESLSILAMYDLQPDEQHTISLLHPNRDRQAAHKERYGTICRCFLCDYEEAKIIPHNLLIVIRMGHWYFQQEQLDLALRCYQHVLDRDVTKSDVWHAVGAVLLAQKKFRLAQQHWKDAIEKHPSLKDHSGVALQSCKEKAYRYYAENHKTFGKSDAALPKFKRCFDGECFITEDPAVSRADCKKVIDWAEANNSWTTSRHYAVPTNDVPVHTIPALLQWFQSWMDNQVRLLLGKQFDLAPEHFFVHDAFVVRYEATQSNNFLPVHVDESTHSFVLALNDDFDGGGTYFCDSFQSVCPKVPGTLVSFRGDSVRHGGNVVTSGVRYILAGFLYYDPPISRKRALTGNTDSTAPFRFGFEP